MCVCTVLKIPSDDYVKGSQIAGHEVVLGQTAVMKAFMIVHFTQGN